MILLTLLVRRGPDAHRIIQVYGQVNSYLGHALGDKGHPWRFRRTYDTAVAKMLLDCFIKVFARWMQSQSIVFGHTADSLDYMMS